MIKWLVKNDDRKDQLSTKLKTDDELPSYQRKACKADHLLLSTPSSYFHTDLKTFANGSQLPHQFGTSRRNWQATENSGQWPDPQLAWSRDRCSKWPYDDWLTILDVIGHKDQHAYSHCNHKRCQRSDSLLDTWEDDSEKSVHGFQ